MERAIDMTGQKFGRLTVLEKAESKHGQARWVCKCDCGRITTVFGYSLRNGSSNSCGCLAKERSGRPRIHDKKYRRIYRIWNGMNGRCYKKDRSNYKNYGGRGIRVCQEWRTSFEAFRAWALTNGYQDDLTIDRIDVNGEYCPENCRWATQQEQQNNRRNNRIISCFGESHTIRQWSEIRGIKKDTLMTRLKSGWSVERALTEKVRTIKK